MSINHAHLRAFNAVATHGSRYPRVQLSISFGNSEQLLKSLLSSKCDIAVLPNVPGDDRRLSSVPLKPDRLVVFVNQSHAWAKRNSVRLWELKDERLALRVVGFNTRALFIRAMREMQIPVNDVMEIGSREGVREAVAADLGVGGRFLERQGLIEPDAENSYLASDAVDDESMAHLQGHSITYRIAMGPQTGRKVFTLQTLPACDPDDPLADTVGKTAGFSLHAGVAVKAREKDKLERLCRYIIRPAVSKKRLSLKNQGKVRYELKTPYWEGTTHVIFHPRDFIARLAALVPRPRVNLTRFHGVFAPNNRFR